MTSNILSGFHDSLHGSSIHAWKWYISTDFFFSFRFIYNKTKKYEHFYYYTLCAACRNTYVQYRFRVVRIVVTLEMYKSIVSPRDYCGGSKKKTISKKYGFIEILHCKMSFRLSPVKYNK